MSSVTRFVTDQGLRVGIVRLRAESEHHDGEGHWLCCSVEESASVSEIDAVLTELQWVCAQEQSMEVLAEETSICADWRVMRVRKDGDQSGRIHLLGSARLRMASATSLTFSYKRRVQE